MDCLWDLIYILALSSLGHPQIGWRIHLLILTKLRYFSCFLDKLCMLRACQLWCEGARDLELSSQLRWLRTQSASRYPGILHLEETCLDLHRSLRTFLPLAAKSIFELRSSDRGNG